MIIKLKDNIIDNNDKIILKRNVKVHVESIVNDDGDLYYLVDCNMKNKLVGINKNSAKIIKKTIKDKNNQKIKIKKMYDGLSFMSNKEFATDIIIKYKKCFSKKYNYGVLNDIVSFSYD